MVSASQTSFMDASLTCGHTRPPAAGRSKASSPSRWSRRSRQPGATAYFKLPGGQVGRYRRVMVGAPHCAPGDELVLFLKGAPAVPMPFGLTQGVYRVSRDAAGQATVLPIVNVDSSRVVRGDPSRRSRTRRVHQPRANDRGLTAMNRRQAQAWLAIAMLTMALPGNANAYIHLGSGFGGQPDR